MLHIERHEGVVVWTIDRPAAKNALDHATIAALAEALEEARHDARVRAVILTGAGQTFVSGGDLRELREKNSREEAERFSDLGWHLCHAMTEVPFPVLCALPGPAIGGGAELAMACDIRIADARAKLSFKQVRMGVTTAWGTAARLVASVSAGTAARLLYAGHELTAEEARTLGLVDEVTEDGRALETAMAWAGDIARGSPSAIAEMKRLVRAAMAPAHDVRALERKVFTDTWCSADHQEAVEAFFERRPARWSVKP
ncbi:MAG: enoyl-CoA hydratase/isomerase family protein [Polyangiaceae bacterium]|nr:enoyl-CoA hydratase/isomerase family protein [Polyangiaceae bacterium]